PFHSNRLFATEKTGKEERQKEAGNHHAIDTPQDTQTHTLSRHMASKYAFGQGLKELRFLFCQTSEHSAPVRYVLLDNFYRLPLRPTSQPWAHSDIFQAEKTQADCERRNFLTRSYPTMKKHNPHTPIMIREASGTEPTLYARFDFGKEKKVSLKGLDDKAIEQQVTQLAQSNI
ncbi:hypothetical protein J1614_004762, partial [Plenodomus biglobosus]